MNKIIGLIFVTIIIANSIFAAELYEMSCEDGTKYMKCSQYTPGFICAPTAAGDSLELQNIAGAVYPDGHPKEGESTKQAEECSCDNFDGFTLKDGRCYNPDNPDATKDIVEPNEETDENTNTVKEETTDDDTIEEETDETSDTEKETDDDTKEKSTPSKEEDKDAVKIKKLEPKEEDTQIDEVEKDTGTNYGFIFMVLGIVAISAGGLFFIALIIALIAFVFLKKGNKGLGK